MAMPWWRWRERWHGPGGPPERTGLTAWEHDRFEEIVAAFDDAPGRASVPVWAAIRHWIVPVLGAIALAAGIVTERWPLLAVFGALACVELVAVAVAFRRRPR